MQSLIATEDFICRRPAVLEKLHLELIYPPPLLSLVHLQQPLAQNETRGGFTIVVLRVAKRGVKEQGISEVDTLADRSLILSMHP